MKHTSGPLRVDVGVNETYVRGPNNELVADTHTLPVPERHDEEQANARRIVASWNACEGINPEAVPGLLRALQRMSNEFENNGLPMTSLPGYAKAAIALAASPINREDTR